VKGDIFEKFDIKDNGCWIWNRALTQAGYGVFGHENKVVYGHRHMYEKYRGPIPAGMVLDHQCNNKACVNPDHLEVSARGENSSRTAREATHCMRGHEYNEKNTLYCGNKRFCRLCRAIREKLKPPKRVPTNVELRGYKK